MTSGENITPDVQHGTVESQLWGRVPATLTTEPDGTRTYRVTSGLGGAMVRLRGDEAILRTFRLN